ncbi:MAG TPA: ribosome silencing factor [Gammaproteobacteria bacterium]|nr:ribosome silencing factor [Gammaproteobacteria bacterium]
MTPKQLLDLVLVDLDDLKAVNISPLDVRNMTPIADFLVIATGNSSRHVASLCENLVRKMKARNITPLGVQGDKDEEWVLLDLGDVVVHIMQPRIRDFYNLEKLWTFEVPQAANA